MTTRNRVSTLALAAAVGAAGFGLAPSEAAAQQNVRWQVPMAFASTLTALGDTMPWVSEQLARASGGRIQLQVAEPGTVIPALSIFENVSNGNVDAGYSWMGYEWGQVPATALFGAVPFGLEPAEFSAWMYFHGGQEMLDELMAGYNVKAIFCGSISPEAAGWFRTPIDNVADLDGLKFRAAGVGGEIMAELGMSVTMLPGGELYQALETGVLDATEFSLPTVDQQLGFYQVAKYYLLPGWHQPSTNQYLYINLEAWNDLDEPTQGMIELACTAGVAYAIAKAEALQGEALSYFEEQGVELVTLSDELLNAFQDATDTVMARRSEQDEMFGRVYASMRAFQEELNPWRRLGYLPRDWDYRFGE
jgi:TRAP-type mannitol/chloroaromatic compound transport system substrate-binding protein